MCEDTSTTSAYLPPCLIEVSLQAYRERGSGKWERASWGEALDTIATGLKEVKEEYVPEPIAGYVDLNRLAG